MDGAGIKWGPCPPILYWLYTKFTKEYLLKVSLKNIHPLKSSKSPLFQKGLRYFCQIGKLSKNLKAKNSKIVNLILGLTATLENCQKKFTATPENCQKEIVAHSHTGKLSNCILKLFFAGKPI